MTRFGLIHANIRNKPLQSSLILGSLALASFMIVSTATVVARMAAAQPGSQDAVLVVVPNGNAYLPIAHQQAIQRLPGVKGLDYIRVRTVREPTTNLSYGVWSVSDGFFDVLPKNVADPSQASVAAFRGDRQGILVAKSLADRFHWNVGSMLEVPLRGKPVTGKIVGYAEGFDRGIFMHFDHSVADSMVHSFHVRCDKARLTDLIKEIDANFETHSFGTLTMTREHFSEVLSSNSASIRSMFLIVGLVIVIITCVTTASTLSIVLRERTAELATLRAIGFSNGSVAGLILGEATLIGLVGGFVGSVIPYVFFAVRPYTPDTANTRSAMEMFRGVTIPTEIMLAGCLAAVVVSALVSLGPLSSALRKPIIEGLAH